jgi:hypothetical protein
MATFMKRRRREEELSELGQHAGWQFAIGSRKRPIKKMMPQQKAPRGRYAEMAKPTRPQPSFYRHPLQGWIPRPPVNEAMYIHPQDAWKAPGHVLTGERHEAAAATTPRVFFKGGSAMPQIDPGQLSTHNPAIEKLYRGPRMWRI